MNRVPQALVVGMRFHPRLKFLLNISKTLKILAELTENI